MRFELIGGKIIDKDNDVSINSYELIECYSEETDEEILEFFNRVSAESEHLTEEKIMLMSAIGSLPESHYQDRFVESNSLAQMVDCFDNEYFDFDSEANLVERYIAGDWHEYSFKFSFANYTFTVRTLHAPNCGDTEHESVKVEVLTKEQIEEQLRLEEEENRQREDKLASLVDSMKELMENEELLKVIEDSMLFFSDDYEKLKEMATK